MNTGSGPKLCKNKNCRKVLPEGYKYSYCEACRNDRAHATKVIGKIGSALVGVAACLVGIVVSGGQDKSKNQNQGT